MIQLDSLENYVHSATFTHQFNHNGIDYHSGDDGLRAKFVQNPHILRTLLSTGNKLLVESSKDNIWGTGIPLSRWDCLQQKYWNGNSLLSGLLMEIRDSCKETTSMEAQNS